MRDRSRQFADSRIAVEVCKLGQALARFDFGEMAAAPFVEQSADQSPLDQDYGRNQRQLPAILFPNAWLTKQDLAFQRKVALNDAPALHRPGVVKARRRQRVLLKVRRPRRLLL